MKKAARQRGGRKRVPFSLFLNFTSQDGAMPGGGVRNLEGSSAASSIPATCGPKSFSGKAQCPLSELHGVTSCGNRFPLGQGAHGLCHAGFKPVRAPFIPPGSPRPPLVMSRRSGRGANFITERRSLRHRLRYSTLPSHRSRDNSRSVLPKSHHTIRSQDIHYKALH